MEDRARTELGDKVADAIIRFVRTEIAYKLNWDNVTIANAVDAEIKLRKAIKEVIDVLLEKDVEKERDG
jgi:ribosomal protein L31E